MSTDKYTIYIDSGDAHITIHIRAEKDEEQDEDGWFTVGTFDPQNENDVSLCIDACGRIIATFVEVQQADDPENFLLDWTTGIETYDEEDALVFEVYKYNCDGGFECLEGPKDVEIADYLCHKGF